MTEEQSKLIDSIIAEFNKISAQPIEPRPFNLIDISPIIEKNRVKEQWKADHLARSEEWQKRAENEANRIASLLQRDLHPLKIEVEKRTIIIINSASYHLYMRVDVKSESFTDPYGEVWKFPVRFEYQLQPTCGPRFQSIQELVDSELFAEEIRGLLSKQK